MTPDRLAQFALADRQGQVIALAELRARSVDDSNAISMGFASLMIAGLVVGGTPALTIELDPQVRGSWIAMLIFWVVVVVMLLLALVPALFAAARDQARKELASVWLGAFEDELARRHRLRGCAARRWQRDH